MNEYINCFSCGARSLNFEGEGHRYMLSAPGCYEMYMEVLEKEYTDFQYAKAHHYTVDAYSCQHPGSVTGQRAINSVGIHLVSLYMLFEKGMDLSSAAEIKMNFSQYNKDHNIIEPLERPDQYGSITIFDVWNNEDPRQHFNFCRKWAFSTWKAWEKHHPVIERWAGKFLQ